LRPNLNAHHPWPGPVPALEAEGVSPSEDPLVLTPPRSERTRQVGVTVGPWGHYNPRPTNRKVAFKAATNLPTAFRRQQKSLLPREREPGHRFTGLFPSAAGQPSRHVGVGSRALRHPIPRVSPFRGFVANPLYPTPPEGLHSFGRISEKKRPSEDRLPSPGISGCSQQERLNQATASGRFSTSPPREPAAWGRPSLPFRQS